MERVRVLSALVAVVLVAAVTVEANVDVFEQPFLNSGS